MAAAGEKALRERVMSNSKEVLGSSNWKVRHGKPVKSVHKAVDMETQ